MLKMRIMNLQNKDYSNTRSGFHISQYLSFCKLWPVQKLSIVGVVFLE